MSSHFTPAAHRSRYESVVHEVVHEVALVVVHKVVLHVPGLPRIEAATSPNHASDHALLCARGCAPRPTPGARTEARTPDIRVAARPNEAPQEAALGIPRLPVGSKIDATGVSHAHKSISA